MTKVNEFNREIKIIIDNTTSIPKKENFRNLMRNKKIISIPTTVVQSWLTCKIIIREKSQLESWNVEFSDKAIDSLLVDFVYRMKYEAKYDLQKSVKLWFEELKKSRVITYVIFRPVYHLLTDLILDFGKVKIQKISEDVVHNYHPNPQDPYFTSKKIAGELINDAKTDTYAIVEVNAKDNEHAEILSKQYLEKALNVIRIFHTGTKVRSVENFCPVIHVPHFIIIKNTTEFTSGGENLNLNTPTMINSTTLTKLQPTWDKLVALLFKDQLNEIESQILTALYWYGEGYKDENPSSSFLKYITALENLVIFDRQYDKADRVSERISSIIYPEGEDRLSAMTYMKKYYEIRNSIIHAGKTRVYQEDVEQVRVWTQVLLQIFIRKHDPYNKLSDLLEKEYQINSSNKKQFSLFRKMTPFLKQIFSRS